IGIETARTLARRGADVTIAARRLDAAGRVALEITADTGNPKGYVAAPEPTDRASVAALPGARTRPPHLPLQQPAVLPRPQPTPHRGRPREAVRDHPPRPLRPHPPSAPRPRARERRRTRRDRQLIRTPLRPRRLRRHRLPLPPLRRPQRLRTVQDRRDPPRR